MTFPTQRKFGVSGAFPEHRKDGYHMVRNPIIMQVTFHDISCICPAGNIKYTQKEANLPSL